MSIRNQIKGALYKLSVAASSGETCAQDTVSVVCIHGVHSADMRRVARPPTSSVSASAFEANLHAIARHHTVVPLREAVDMLAGRIPLRPRCVALTFDDSLECTESVAVPILTKLGMTATMFLSTEAIDSQRPYWWLRLDHAWVKAREETVDVEIEGTGLVTVNKSEIDSLRRLKAILRRTDARIRDEIVCQVEVGLDALLENTRKQYPFASLMSWQQAQKLVKLGFNIGSHTVTHPNLALLSHDDVRRELADSKVTLERQTGATCEHFCYPYGSFKGVTQNVVREVGYVAATSTIAPGANRTNQDLFQIRRYQMPGIPWKLGYLLSK